MEIVKIAVVASTVLLSSVNTQSSDTLELSKDSQAKTSKMLIARGTRTKPPVDPPVMNSTWTNLFSIS
ncbi:hypothetical protein KIH87_06330 [Paraneptunicella aestuarii]|uniref:hypothetical protein n=1 Tax=Paraneptunicella aestuarii TaxID=2831148 RepID=UPI001E42D13C|nr:hypothetical protein [Paraneptunicella aestuarii]UAA39964.1 hypothetical protein KIH87_06330 [Paraneptunicella aestuarii]